MLPVQAVEMSVVDATIKLPGYSILQAVYKGTRTLVYRGTRELDRQPVVLKFMRNEYSSFSELVQFRNQYAVAKNLDLPGIVRPYSLENYRNGYVLVMEDFGGISLKDYTASRPLSLPEFLAIALQIASILDELHRQRVIHKDLKPANILINPSTQQVKLIDFSIASLLPKETQVLTSPNVLEGTLAYLSPEQTGRMNRGIDYRSDFYSLGVTFYELLTGKLPFTSTDPLELVHCHIAKQPPIPSSINPAIPQAISDIINKLMAKMAEDRYQSALGLKSDLEICLQQLEKSGQIAQFELGKRDISDRFIIPEKLYGREVEVQTLLDAFKRVSAGTKEMMLVAGYSGIGKTAIVNEVHKPIVRQRGYFTKGKFDQFQRNIPFSAFVQALRDLIKQILSESSQKIQQWRAKILSAVGENGQVIIDVIPEVELLIEKQPSVPELDPSAAQNRFNLVFQKFIGVFSSAEHPLVIFLDDLQWADSASLKLMPLLMSDSDIRYLMLIGAYRDNEVYPAHATLLTLEEIKSTKVPVHTITLPPLNQTNLNGLIADTLSCPSAVASPLTQLIYTKTKGNPFFSNQFLKALYEDGLINFNFKARYWQCDIAQVKALALTDDVVEFMALKLQKLPETTQEVLKLAACIGNSFDLSTLAIVHEKTQAETATELWKALQEGFVIPKNEIYKFFQEGELEDVAKPSDFSVPYTFVHDRVQQAAYLLIPEDRKKSTHLKIGQLLLKNIPEDEREERIFEIVNQLNMGAKLIAHQSEKDELAKLNLIAGQKAEASTAYVAAKKYLTVGLDLLAVDSWQTHYDLTLALYESAAKTMYLNGDFEQMEQFVVVVLQQANSLPDKIKVYETKIQAYQSQNQLLEAVETGLSILTLLEIEFPQSPQPSDIQAALAATLSNLAGREIKDLVNLPIMTDPSKLAAIRILTSILPGVFIGTPHLFPFLVFHQVNLSLQYGNAADSALAYTLYGLILCAVVGDIESGYQFGQLALSLVNQVNFKLFKPKTIHIVNGFIKHWKQPVRSTLKYLLEAHSSAMEVGDLEYATFATAIYCYSSYITGKELAGLEQEMLTYSAQMRQLKQGTQLNYNEMFRQAVKNLLGQSENPRDLMGEAYNEKNMLPIHQQANDFQALYFFYFNKLKLAYLFQDYLQAIDHANQAEKYLQGVTGMSLVPLLYFFDSLARLGIYSQANSLDREDILSRVQANQSKLENWSKYAPMNYLHKFYLVEAERHRVLGARIEAMEMFDRAISLAKENKYTQDEALANELAAQLYLSWGKDKIASTYIVDAYYGYARWGAKAKVDDLERRYFEFLMPILQQEKTSFDPNETIASPTYSATTTFGASSTSVSEALDLATVIKASQALSGEIHLDSLLSTFMQVVMENAGASKCALILNEKERLHLAATSTSLMESNEVAIALIPSLPIEASLEIPVTLINYVNHTEEALVIHNVASNSSLASDPYIERQQPKSLLCMPLTHQGKLIGILYLENHLTTGAFTSDRLEILKLLGSQAAISLDNARLYNESQNYAKQLEDSYEKLQQAQLQIVQSEKMATIGQLVAGVAHEINNPVGFIDGNLNHTLDYIQDLLDHLALYQKHYPEPASEIADNSAEIDLDFLIEDLPKMLASMKQGTDRIRNISHSLRTFSRADNAHQVPFNLHEGIDSTLLILRHRLKANDQRPAIEVIQNYGNLPAIKCYPGQLNQVLLNLLANAIDALEDSNQGKSFADIQAHPNRITITTEMAADNRSVIIRIADNGIGMTEEVKQLAFDYLFTTKAVGKGTGLGLAIARQIIEEKHQGQLSVSSTLGKETEFTIQIPIS